LPGRDKLEIVGANFDSRFQVLFTFNQVVVEDVEVGEFEDHLFGFRMGRVFFEQGRLCGRAEIKTAKSELECLIENRFFKVCPASRFQDVKRQQTITMIKIVFRQSHVRFRFQKAHGKVGA
jgi:hypothetical protein